MELRETKNNRVLLESDYIEKDSFHVILNGYNSFS